MFFEIARNSTGLLDSRLPIPCEAEARAAAAALAEEHGEAFQLWDHKRMIDCDFPQLRLTRSYRGAL